MRCEDYHNGRVYLSVERLEQCGVSMDDEMNSGPSEKYKNCGNIMQRLRRMTMKRYLII